MDKHESTSQAVDAATLLARWVAEGFITSDQADRIRAYEGLGRVLLPRQATAPVSERRVTLVDEALGYLGGVLILVAVVLIAARYWDGMALWGRLALPAAAAALLLAAGAAVPERLGTAAGRLRSVLWLGSAGAVAFFLALVGADGFDWQRGEDVALLAGAGTAGYAGALWMRQRAIPQQAALFAALLVTVGAAAAQVDSSEAAPSGLAIWGLGVVWMVLGWRGLLSPRRAAYVLGAVGAVVGGLATAQSVGWGYVFALATVAALVGVAVLLGDLVLLAIGALGALQVLPAAVMHFFPGALAAPLALLAAGVVLVAAGLRTTRRRGRPPSG